MQHEKEENGNVMVAKFEVGQKVWWKSQAGGYRQENMGEIISIVPAGELPFKEGENHPKSYVLADGQVIPRSRARYGGGQPRSQVSYIVRAQNKKTPHKVGLYYWPPVGVLNKILPGHE